MTVTIVGTDKLLRRLDAVKDGKPTLRDIQIRAVREAKLRVARKTGHTGHTIAPGELTGDHAIVKAAGAAVYLEHGTKPHVILPGGGPKRASVLSWTEGKRLSGRNRTGRAAGGRIFAKKVRHPGTRPQPFLMPGAEEAVRQVGVGAIVKAWNTAA